MRRKFKRCVAVMLAVSTIMSSIPVDYAFAGETSTEVSLENTTEKDDKAKEVTEIESEKVTEKMTESGSGEEVKALSTSESEEKTTESNKEDDTSSEDTSDDEETKESEEKTNESNSEVDSSEDVSDDETTVESETESDSDSETKKDSDLEGLSTEGTGGNNEVTEESEDASNDGDEEKGTENNETLPEEVKGKVTFLSATSGGKLVVKDSSNNVIKEVAFVESGIPFEYEGEEGEVITVDVVSDGEGYEVATYRLTIDSGEEKENVVYDEGTTRDTRYVTVSKETQNVVVTFNEVEETEAEEPKDLVKLQVASWFGWAYILDGVSSELIELEPDVVYTLKEGDVLKTSCPNGITYIGASDSNWSVGANVWGSPHTEDLSYTAEELAKMSKYILVGFVLYDYEDIPMTYATGSLSEPVKGQSYGAGSWTLTNVSTSSGGMFLGAVVKASSKAKALKGFTVSSINCGCHAYDYKTGELTCNGNHPSGGAVSPSSGMSRSVTMKITSIGNTITSGTYKGYKKVSFNYTWNTNGSSEHINGLVQVMRGKGYYYVPANGTLTINKRVRDADFVASTPRIALSTKFGVYDDVNCVSGEEVATLTIKSADSNTGSGSVSLEEGTYYVKEITRSTGASLNQKVYGPYKITAGDDVTVTDEGYQYVYNEPFYFRGNFLRKIDSSTKGPLEGAVIKATYSPWKKDNKAYDEMYTWYFRSGADGYFAYDNAHYVATWNGNKSDALITFNGTPSLPLGFLYCVEVEAPANYKLNSTEKVVSFAAKTDADGLYTDQVLTCNVQNLENASDTGYIKVVKQSAETGTSTTPPGYSFVGAEYGIYNSSGDLVETLSIGSNGEALSGKLPVGDYVVKETTKPNGYELDKKEYPVTVTVNNTTSQPVVVTSEEEETPGYVKVKKSSTRPEVTNGNSMYSFDGAKFGVFSDEACTKSVGTLTADASGETGTLRLLAGTYYVKELEPAPKGYKLNTEVKSVTVVHDGSTKTVEIADEPLVGVLDISLVAKQNDCATTRSLEGANFQVNFYGSDKAEGAPLRSWVLSTDQEGYAYLQSIYKVSGDALYGENLLPLGTIEVKEIKAPEGYVINSTDVKSYTLTQNNTTGTVEMPEVTPVNIVDITEYGGVKIKKVDNDTGSVQGDATLEGATYAIIVNDDDTLTRSSDMNTDVAFAKGEEIYRITTDENGIAQTPTVDVRGTEYQLLQSGKYIVKEVDPSTGYLLPDWSLEFEITENGQVVDLTGNTCKEPIIRGGFVIYKGDAELREIYSQGDSSLANAEFTLINKSENVVTVDTDNDGTLEEYASGAVIMKVYTDENGKYTSPEKLLPYGTYELKETNVPEGYLLEGISLTRTFSIRSEGEIKKFAVADKTATNDNGATLDNVIRGGVRVSKWDVELDVENKVQGDATLEKAEFTIYNRSAHDVLVDTDGDGEFERYKVNDEITKIYTNEKGVAETSSEFLPYGTYEVKETKSPTGYTMLGKNLTRTVSIREDGKIYEFTSTDSATKNEVIRGGVSIAKWDIELNVENATQGDATLKGAEFTIYNKSKESVLVDTDGDGEVETYEPGDEIIVLVTDKEGKVSTKGDFLPYGTYEITETKSPEGYTYFGENITRTVQIREDGKIYPLTDKTTATKNRVIRGDIEILKFKGDLSTEEPDDRVTSLSGIQFEISLKSSGDVVTTLTTDSRGYATTESSEYPYGRLPYGLYVIHEVEESIPEGIAPVDDFEVFIGRTGSVIGTIDSDATVFGDNNEYVDGNVYKGYYLNDRQSEMPIRVVKVSTESNEVIPLEGFTFQILDKNKDVVEFHLRYPHNQVVTEFTTDETGEAVLPEKLPYGTYYVHELEAPYGCILSKDLEFKVNSWSSWDNILEVRFPDDFAKGKVVITKYDKNTNTVLEGATFDIYANEDIITPDKVLRHSKGDYIETVTIGAEGTGTSSELYLGKYYFVETYAPNGFLLEENKTEFELVYEDDKTPIVYEYRDIYDKPIRFELYKYDIDGEELEGVTFKIEKVEDIEYTVTETSTDTPNPDTISGGTFVTDENGLITKDYWLPGIYSVTETATLPGYVLDDTVRYFKVEANGTISEVYNTEEGEEESEGLDADWYSNTVDSTGNVNKLTLSWKNDYTKWDFSKVDVTGDTELVGAEMEIYNSDNELVYSWTSDGELHRINKIPLGDYTLVEKTAPKGYVIASAVPFTVINTGVVQKATMIDKIVEAYKVDESGNGVVGATMVVYKQDEADSSGVFIDEVDRWVTDGTAHRVENLVVGKTYQLVEEKSPEGWVLSTPVTFTVYDDFKDQEVAMTDIRVKAHKYDETLETYVEGAKLQVIDSADNVVDEWVTTDEFHYISGLVAGKSYTLVEVAAPEGFALAKPVNFTVEDNGKDQEVVMVNKKVLVSKVDTEVKELAGAELEVRDSEGNVIDKWVSDGTPHAIIGLVVGETYTLVETKAPEGYAIATPIEFTVADNAKNGTIDLINKQVFVTKTDVTGEKEIEGATLIVYDKEGNEVDKWVSGSEAHPISNIVVGETYVLHEELAPEGYVIASDIEFTVMDDFKVQQVVMKDKQVFVTKKSVTGEDELPGAELYVVEKETGKEVDSWTSGTEAHAVSGLEVGKNYTLIEKTAPMGYVIATEVDFYVADDFTIQTVEMLDKQVFMHKHDVTGEKEIPGANIVVTDKETGDVVDRWTSGEEPHAISGLVVNKTYILHEELAPEGYVIASDVEFTVLDDFKVQTVEMKDKQVFVSKKSVTGTSELEGATLSVYDEEGKVVDTWVSGKEEHAVSGLVVGKTYTLVEEIAPSGYVVAEKITFTVEDDFTIQHVEMRDKQVFVSKKDVTGDNELPGAKLTVIDKETGEKVDEWISTEEEHPVSGLEVKKTYILIEETAPEGFVVAEQIEFTVEDDFTIQHVEMFDKQVFVSKQDITTGEEIGGAHLQVVDKDGNIIDEWVSEEGVQHPISGLVVGETYTLIETLAPDGYVTAEDIEFTVLDDLQIQEVVMLDDYTKVEISKQDATTGKELPGAKLVLYDEDGEIVDEWTSGDEPHYIEYLPVGKYTLHEDLAPVGYEIANDVEFEVEDTGEVQQVVMKDEPTPVVKKIAQTGENMIIFVSAGIAVLIALIGLFLVLKKRKRNA